MKTILVALSAAAGLAATPAAAQTAAQGGRDPAKPADMAKMTPEEMHKHCGVMMGAKMQGRPKHDHAADKLGHAPATKPPSEAEMKAMHEKCAAMMADKKPAPAPTK